MIFLGFIIIIIIFLIIGLFTQNEILMGASFGILIGFVIISLLILIIQAIIISLAGL